MAPDQSLLGSDDLVSASTAPATPTSPERPLVMWSDVETAVDALNVQHLVRAILTVVRDTTLSPVTVGVFGPWGSGKSSVAQMVLADLTTTESAGAGVVAVYFNGWRFEGYEDAKAALSAAILEALEARAQKDPTLWEKTKGALGRMRKRVNWLRVGKTALAVGFAAKTGGLSLLVSKGADVVGKLQSGDTTPVEGYVKDAADVVAPTDEAAGETVHETIRDFDAAFEELLELSGVTRLVVVIDDLDRCLPDRVIDTLEAIRLFLSVPRTAFIISADERLIEDAIAYRFRESAHPQPTLGRQYLEKMIQVPVRVPPLAPEDVEQYIALLFTQGHLASEAFRQLCANVRNTTVAAAQAGFTGLVADRFTAATATRYIKETAVTAPLREDLAFAAQIAPVLGLSAQGNPRLLKRFLNALQLRLLMASSRGVTLRRDVAAKLLLLEYHAPTIFEGLARAVIEGYQATPDGSASNDLMRLEREFAQGRAANVPEAPAATTRATVPAPETGAAPKRRTAAAESDRPPRKVTRGGDERAMSDVRAAGEASIGASAAEHALPAWAVAARSDPWLRAWFASEPSLIDIDLRPYLYFAREGILTRVTAGAALGAGATEVLRLLLVGGSANLAAAAGRLEHLHGGEVGLVFSEIARRVRATSEPFGEPSLLTGVFALTTAKPELIPETIALLSAISVTLLGPAVVPRILTMATALEARGIPAADAFRALLETWARQSTNSALATAAERMLSRLTAGAGNASTPPPATR